MLALALAGCGIAGRDCSPAARLEAHSAERAEFRRALAPILYTIPCPSTVPEVLIPEEERVAAAKRRLIGRIVDSELAGDLAEAQRAAEEAARNVTVDCVGFRWTGEEHVREARANLEREMRELRAVEARFVALARRIALC